MTGAFELSGYCMSKRINKRRESRESAFKIVFGININGLSAEEAIELAETIGEHKVDKYSKSIITAVYDNLENIDKYIKDNLKDWDIKRVSKISLAILRMSCAEIFYIQKASDSIVINEAVEISKKYGDEDDYIFINGLLGSISRSKIIDGEEKET
jgi:N utilization substance protein B